MAFLLKTEGKSSEKISRFVLAIPNRFHKLSAEDHPPATGMRWDFGKILDSTFESTRIGKKL